MQVAARTFQRVHFFTRLIARHRECGNARLLLDHLAALLIVNKIVHLLLLDVDGREILSAIHAECANDHRVRVRHGGTGDMLPPVGVSEKNATVCPIKVGGWALPQVHLGRTLARRDTPVDAQQTAISRNNHARDLRAVPRLVVGILVNERVRALHALRLLTVQAPRDTGKDTCLAGPVLTHDSGNAVNCGRERLVCNASKILQGRSNQLHTRYSSRR